METIAEGMKAVFPELIKYLADGWVVILTAAVVVVLAVLARLSRPRVAYLEFPAYDDGQFAILVVNLDAAPLGRPMAFRVDCSQLEAVRAFPVSNREKVKTSFDDKGVRIEISDLQEDENLMLVFEHSGERQLVPFSIGKPEVAKKMVVPRGWRALPSFRAWTRAGHVGTRVLVGICAFVASYGVLRGGFSSGGRTEASSVWDATLLLVGSAGVACAFFLAGLQKGRWIGVPFEAEGTRHRATRKPVQLNFPGTSSS